MGKIILFYKYVYIQNPQALAAEQLSLCQDLGLLGRIIIAHEGINATLGGPKDAIERYKQTLLDYPLFRDVDIKEGDGEAAHFPRLKVMVKKEIVRFGVDPDLVSARDAGKYLSAQEVHALLEQSPEDMVVLDVRNNYESRVGAFKDAVLAPINHFRELPDYIDKNLEQFKDKQVVMYCTGGVRCERATAYLKKKKVAKEVYHIKGGIHRYAEAFPQGFFKGKNYVFDGRVTHQVTQDVLAHCEHCNISYDDYSNCVNAECNKQIIVCPTCIPMYHNTCSQHCLELVRTCKVNIRTLPHKILIRACTL